MWHFCCCCFKQETGISAGAVSIGVGGIGDYGGQGFLGLGLSVSGVCGCLEAV